MHVLFNIVVVYTVCDANGLELSATTAWQSLASPNYPNLYPDNTDCTWTIRAPQTDQKISIWLQSVHMEESADGCHDELTILNGKTKVTLNNNMQSEKIYIDISNLSLLSMKICFLFRCG